MWTNDNKWFLTDEAFEDRFQGNTMEAVCIGDWKHLTPEEIKNIADMEVKNKVERREKHFKQQIGVLLSWDDLGKDAVDEIQKFYNDMQGQLFVFPLPESFRKSKRGNMLKDIPTGTLVRFTSDLKIFASFKDTFLVEVSIQTIDYVDVKERE